jgi:hemerythrin-like domain-containing protein/nucleotide-binding universal stress UspA family protein
MYQHILVALDDSNLASQTVTSAIAFARAMGARITFFHATADYAATSDVALHHAMHGESFPEAALGQTNAILWKAVTAASAAGIVCDEMSATSGDPAHAIVEAASQKGCDLIFVSSHGVRPGIRGWFSVSNTQRLLQFSPLPVHVAAVESNLPDADANRALAVIQGEHRSIGSALRGLQHLVVQGRSKGSTLDVSLMRLIVDYMKAFPEALHHPKEETHLFRLLRLRAPELSDTIEELIRQHETERSLVDSLDSALGRYERREAGAFDAVAGAVKDLTSAVLEHLNLEESTVLPAARRLLEPEDWKVIVESFEANREPLGHGEYSEHSFDDLFVRIANRLTPIVHGSATS